MIQNYLYFIIAFSIIVFIILISYILSLKDKLKETNEKLEDANKMVDKGFKHYSLLLELERNHLELKLDHNILKEDYDNFIKNNYLNCNFNINKTSDYYD